MTLFAVLNPYIENIYLTKKGIGAYTGLDIMTTLTKTKFKDSYNNKQAFCGKSFHCVRHERFVI